MLKGGGGTDFEPIFKYIEDHELEVDAIVYITDGRCNFPKERDIKTIWLITTDVVPPFGEYIKLD